MREIKFRAWDKKKKRMMYYPLGVGIHLDKGDEETISYGTGMNTVTVHPKSKTYQLMQYTGLKDENNKEIYEGDILQDDNDDIFEVKFGKLPLDKSRDCVCTYEAFYCKGYGQLGQAPSYECQEIREWMKVIGNIYKNPELLK